MWKVNTKQEKLNFQLNNDGIICTEQEVKDFWSLKMHKDKRFLDTYFGLEIRAIG